MSMLEKNCDLEELVAICLATNEMQFWLDASPLPPIISALQLFGEDILNRIFKLTRQYCFTLHSSRLKLLE